MVKREFRVGDRVTCNFNGLGIVKEICSEPGSKYKVEVLFDNAVELNYDIEGKAYSTYKRTLFIVPKRKPTLQEVKIKYKELLDSVEEVEFVEDYDNYTIESYIVKGELSLFKPSYTRTFFLNVKYISEKDTDMIIEKMKEFVNTEI